MHTLTDIILPSKTFKKFLPKFFTAAALLALGTAILSATSGQQAVPIAAPRGGGGGTRGNNIPNATPAQTAAIAQLNTNLAALTQTLATARADLLAQSFAAPKDEAAIKSKIEAIRSAELALATAQADGLAKIQSSDNKLTPDQLAAFTAALSAIRPAGRGNANANGGPGVPNMNSNQVAALTQLTGISQKLTPILTAARAAVPVAAFVQPRNDAAIKAAVDAVAAAEAALANARADIAAKLIGPDKLTDEQLTAVKATGGVIVSGTFSEPLPMDPTDHLGYVSLFDGTTLKGWDGNPKFWRVEAGAIVGESTTQNPSGNTYIAYRDVETKDFTLKLEIKVEGAGGTGIQYRSKTGIPWLTAIAANVTNNVGPVNLNWMMTGPQADFWPSRDTTSKYSGQFYSENTPMRIMAWRGQVVEGYGMGPRRLIGNIGDRTDMAKFIKQNDWNQYTVIARGGVFMHIINGQLMAVMIDDDPTSSNNQPGEFGIEIEATTKVSVRNVWLKKLN